MPIFHANCTRPPYTSLVPQKINLGWLFSFGGDDVEKSPRRGREGATDMEMARSLLFTAALFLDALDRAKDSGEGIHGLREQDRDAVDD